MASREVIRHPNSSYHIPNLSPSGGMDINLALHNANVTATSQPADQEAEDDGDYFRFVCFKVVVPLIFGIIVFVGILGNLLVVHVIRARKKMRTVTNLLLLNLAIADLSFLVICPPFTAYQLATLSWPFPGLLGDVICKLMHYLLNVTVYVTIYTLVLISIIRYLTVVHNAQTVAFRTMQNTVIMIIAIWCVFLLVNIPIPLSYDVHLENDTLVCDNHALEIGQKIYATFFIFAYLLPLSIIAIFSICILRHIRMQQPTMLNKKTKSSQKKKQATRLIILVIVIFAIFWLPIHIHLLVAYYSQIPESRFYTVMSVLWSCLAYCNSCVNPIIYNLTSKDFRDSFRDTVCCVKWSPDWDRDGASFVTKIGQTQTTKTAVPTATKTMVVESNGTGNNNVEADDSQDAEEV